MYRIPRTPLGWRRPEPSQWAAPWRRTLVTDVDVDKARQYCVAQLRYRLSTRADGRRDDAMRGRQTLKVPDSPTTIPS